MPDFMNFLLDDLLVAIPALWFIGYLLKGTPRVQDWTIPWILTGCGVATALALLGIDAGNVIQGILIALAAVGGHQLFKQTNENF